MGPLPHHAPCAAVSRPVLIGRSSRAASRGALRALPVARPETEDDDAIAAGLRAGRLDALARAFDRWHQRVRVLARRLVDDAAAEDVLQETFAALPGAVGRFRGEGDLEALVLSIAVHRAP